MPLSQVDESLAALETQLRSAAADGSHVKSCSAVHEVLPRLLSDALPFRSNRRIAQAVHDANIITVAVSSDESLLATGSTDRTIGIFSLAAVASQDALLPLSVLKVTEAVCLDISWGR